MFVVVVVKLTTVLVVLLARLALYFHLLQSHVGMTFAPE